MPVVSKTNAAVSNNQNGALDLKDNYLIVSLHDLHPGSLTSIQEQVDFVAGLGIPNVSILAVPYFHHQKRLKDHGRTLDFLDQRQKLGDDLVIHGFYHDRADLAPGSFFWTRLYTANEAEFLDLSDGEVQHRIDMARQLWEARGWSVKGFIAPAWLMPKSQDLLLKRMGFTYTTRLGGIHLLRKNEEVQSQSLCYSTRAAWRREASLLWNPWLARRLKNAGVLRLSMHPDDLKYPRIREQIKETLEMALAAGYQPVTYTAYAEM